MSQIKYISFYRFVHIDNPKQLREKLSEHCEKNSVLGTILLAPEGINGMLAGSLISIEIITDLLKSDPRFHGMLIKESTGEKIPFRQLNIKVKKQILTLRSDDLEFPFKSAPYLKPREVHHILKKNRKSIELPVDSPVVLIDTRNQFEVAMGTFEGAINPEMKNFSDFPEFVRQKKQDLLNKKVITFCTGGIRCEKASAILLREGITDVYQLEGGILEYLRQTSGGFFRGECFVFDERIALDKDLKTVSHAKMPL